MPAAAGTASRLTSESTLRNPFRSASRTYASRRYTHRRSRPSGRADTRRPAAGSIQEPPELPRMRRHHGRRSALPEQSGRTNQGGNAVGIQHHRRPLRIEREPGSARLSAARGRLTAEHREWRRPYASLPFRGPVGRSARGMHHVGAEQDAPHRVCSAGTWESVLHAACRSGRRDYRRIQERHVLQSLPA
jgi:hypothetical protein